VSERERDHEEKILAFFPKLRHTKKKNVSTSSPDALSPPTTSVCDDGNHDDCDGSTSERTIDVFFVERRRRRTKRLFFSTQSAFFFIFISSSGKSPIPILSDPIEKLRGSPRKSHLRALVEEIHRIGSHAARWRESFRRRVRDRSDVARNRESVERRG
jgi:hypothetical protein